MQEEVRAFLYKKKYRWFRPPLQDKSKGIIEMKQEVILRRDRTNKKKISSQLSLSPN